jgi:hypothetical protein
VKVRTDSFGDVEHQIISARRQLTDEEVRAKMAEHRHGDADTPVRVS